MAVTYAVEAGWYLDSSDVFVFGTDVLDGGKLLAGVAPVWSLEPFSNDLTAITRSVNVKRGRDGALQELTAGQATITLSDPDGDYNPRNPLSPLYGTVLPRRPIRVTATVAGTTYGIFRGVVDEVSHDAGTKLATITARDGLAWLGQAVAKLEAEPYAGTVAGLFAELLGAIGIDAGLIDMRDTGRDLTSVTTAERFVLDVIREVLAADRGVFYADRDGVFVYEDANAWNVRGLDRTIASGMQGAVSSVGAAYLVNRQTCTAQGGIAQTVEDPDTIASYGVSNGQEVTSPHWGSDAEAHSVASWIVSQNRYPRSPLRGLQLIASSDAAAEVMLAHELGDHLAVEAPEGGTDGEYTVQRLEHTIDLGNKRHVLNVGATYREPTAEVFVFGTDTLDGGAVLGL